MRFSVLYILCQEVKEITYLFLDLSWFQDETVRWYEIAQWPSCFLFVGNQNPYTWPCLQFMPCDFLLRHFPLDKQDGSNKTSSLLIYIYDWVSIFTLAHSIYYYTAGPENLSLHGQQDFKKFNNSELQTWGSRHIGQVSIYFFWSKILKKKVAWFFSW